MDQYPRPSPQNAVKIDGGEYHKMSFDFVDMPSLGVRIPASFKRMAELQSIRRDATRRGLDFQQRGVGRVALPGG
jgi:hypothetical protein